MHCSRDCHGPQDFLSDALGQMLHSLPHAGSQCTASRRGAGDCGDSTRIRPGQCEFVVGQSASGDEVCVCVATDALRKLRFQANFSGRKGASGSRLRARGARANLGGRAVARRAATFW